MNLETLNDPYLENVTEDTNSMIEQYFSPYDVADFTRFAFQTSKVVLPKKIKKDPINPQDIQSCLAFLPIDRIKQTLECTTQLARNYFGF